MNHKEAQWITENGIQYTHDEYAGATVFPYLAKHIPSGNLLPRKIFGVSKENGEKLIEWWNSKLPNIWEYACNFKEASILF